MKGLNRLENRKRILVTAALPYANGPIHLGHLAGAYLPADIYVRFQRAKKRDVIFICGSDEHGVPITIKAEKEGVSPQELVDKYRRNHEESFAKFGMSFDNYSGTSFPHHHKLSQEFFLKLHEKGYLSEMSYLPGGNMDEPILLTSKEQICEAVGIGKTLFMRWVERGLPAAKIDGRWVGQKDQIEGFFKDYIKSQKKTCQ